MKIFTIIIFCSLFVAGFTEGGIIDVFYSFSKEKQTEIIEKDFETLHVQMTELFRRLDNVNNLRKKIKEAKTELDSQNDICLALALINVEMNEMKTKLSKMKEVSELNKLQLQYNRYEETYVNEGKKVKCE